MGIVITDHLTESQKMAAKLMGIEESDMYERLKKLQDKDFYDVTIVIPVYNGEKYIVEAINSAKTQTWNEIEIIVVNDGSTDNTHEICKQIEGITYLIKPNGGTASALNCGIRASHGRWIHWLSADDVLYPTAIADMLEVISTIPNSKNYIYYSHYDIIDQYGVFINDFIEPLSRNYQNREDRFKELMGNFYGNGSTSMIHSSVFKKIKFDEKLPYFEDYDFWLHAMSIGMDMYLVDKKTLKYRNHDGQMTRKVDLKYQGIIRDRYA